MKLTMNRRGEFRCHWSSLGNKCGVDLDARPIYTYHCHIETADILDANGFVFDQLKIDRYFKDKYSPEQPAKSCEKIAVTACEDVKRMIENHMLSHNGMSVIYKISVTIGVGNNGPAEMTAEWVPEAAKPIANVKKRKQQAQVSTDIETVKPPRNNEPWPSKQIVAEAVWQRTVGRGTRRLP